MTHRPMEEKYIAGDLRHYNKHMGCLSLLALDTVQQDFVPNNLFLKVIGRYYEISITEEWLEIPITSLGILGNIQV